MQQQRSQQDLVLVNYSQIKKKEKTMHTYFRVNKGFGKDSFSEKQTGIVGPREKNIFLSQVFHKSFS